MNWNLFSNKLYENGGEAKVVSERAIKNWSKLYLSFKKYEFEVLKQTKQK